MNKQIIITGATGFIGSHLALRLHEKGYTLCIFSRNPSHSQKKLPFAEKHAEWDLNNPEKWLKYISESYGIINLAGASIAGKRWTDGYKKLIINSRVTGTQKLAEAVNSSTNPPQVFVSASAVGYYGNTGDVVINENSPAGDDFLAQVCRNWESAALSAINTRVVIGRIGIVLAQNEGALPRMLAPYKFFLGGALGSGRQWLSWIHIDDLIELFIWVLENPVLKGVVNFTSPSPVTMKQFSNILGKVLRKPSIFRVPSFALKILLGEASAMVLGGQKVFPNKVIEKEFKFRYNELEIALRDILIKKCF